MAGKGRSYTQEFKDSAIQLALNSNKAIKQVAHELEMSDKTLHFWVREYKKSHNLEVNTRDNVKTSSPKESLEEENRRLRKELTEIKKEREILKKAAAYFAKDAL